jgi:hypothetical protein
MLILVYQATCMYQCTMLHVYMNVSIYEYINVSMNYVTLYVLLYEPTMCIMNGEVFIYLFVCFSLQFGCCGIVPKFL